MLMILSSLILQPSFLSRESLRLNSFVPLCYPLRGAEMSVIGFEFLAEIFLIVFSNGKETSLIFNVISPTMSLLICVWKQWIVSYSCWENFIQLFSHFFPLDDVN
eukprot:TRINITY_DN1121_c0_g1_i1.p1 TRINITY_DN1121_c0_g1~~TRINITY_DN1121_c0_g1_i1.p1  ORF type:complete len:105 (-),score=7.65 TRINITY_DN1121_c0_g1_i1:46-360(-)